MQIVNIMMNQDRTILMKTERGLEDLTSAETRFRRFPWFWLQSLEMKNPCGIVCPFARSITAMI